ncbi:hypothetical protein ACOMHN_043318 [Nucella lapillus]
MSKRSKRSMSLQLPTLMAGSECAIKHMFAPATASARRRYSMFSTDFNSKTTAAEKEGRKKDWFGAGESGRGMVKIEQGCLCLCGRG